MPAGIVIRMVVGDLAFILGVLLLIRPGEPGRIVSPAHLLGWAAVVCGVGISALAVMELVRWSKERRRE